MWLNLDAMKGNKVSGGEGNGISTGTLGLFIADVGIGGNEIYSPVSPTVRRTTAFWIDRGFYVRMFSTGQTPSRQDKDAHFDSYPTRWRRVSDEM